jgi:hypothetical protein
MIPVPATRNHVGLAPRSAFPFSSGAPSPSTGPWLDRAQEQAAVKGSGEKLPTAKGAQRLLRKTKSRVALLISRQPGYLSP